MWIFGYGSLLWKVDFPYKQILLGYIQGYDRKFWQASIDHRGSLEKPGRIVTLIPSTDLQSKVWGIAYEIPEDDNIVVSLNKREQQLAHVILDFYPVQDCENLLNNLDSSYPIPCITYIGEVNGPLYLGPASLEEMVDQIASCRGMSGTNSDYIFQLADWHRNHLPHIEDEHLFQIESALRSKNNLNF